MFISYLKLALRNLAKNRLYACINIGGLAFGISIFVFSSILLNYETNHDNMFSKRDRTFVVGSIFGPESKQTIREIMNVRTPYGPLFELEIEEAKAVARAFFRPRLLSVEDKGFNVGFRFVDIGFTRIFDFNYLYGDASAIDDPHGLILTASTAKMIFGRTDVLGEVLELEHKESLHVSAVIEDVAIDSHFNSSFMPNGGLTAIASLALLAKLENFPLEGRWTDFSMFDMTYILLPGQYDREWLTDRVNTISDRHAPEDERDYVSALKIMPLVEIHNSVWESMGIPVLESVRLLGILVLLIACVNYTNLATAQSFGRAREVGLRKTLGATPQQLQLQFLLESITVTFFAMVISLSIIELLIPIYNNLTGKIVILNYARTLPWLALTTLLVGLLAGAYPAYLISRLNPIESLRNTLQKGRNGNFIRSAMTAAQFTISIFMLAMVMIIFFQNEKMRETSNVFPKANIVLLEGIGTQSIQNKHELLKQELTALEGVSSVTYSRNVPFEQSNPYVKVTPINGNETLSLSINLRSVDDDFLETYDIKLLSGRTISRTFSNDVYQKNRYQLNIVINELAAKQLGFDRGQDAIGQSVFRIPTQRAPENHQYTIVGLIPDLNFNGQFAEIKPTAFYIRNDMHIYGSVRVSNYNLDKTLSEIDTVWQQVIRDQPIRRKFLDDVFNVMFNIFQMMNSVIAIFSAVALTLALIGLFGLAQFMAQRRTKEIGIRKIMGASTSQIVRLLIWQFSTPVLWSLVIALPITYLASNAFLNFFANKITFVVPLILLAAIIAISTAWAIVAAHAINIAKASPIQSLRYE